MSTVKRFLGHVYENYLYKISIKLRLRIMIYLILVNVSGLGFYTYFKLTAIDDQLLRLDQGNTNVTEIHNQLLATQAHLGEVTFFILLIGAIYSFFILRSIISPIESLRTRVLDIVNAADLSQRIQHNARDELGAMMHATDTMLEKFHGITREVKTTTGRVMGSMAEMSTIADETKGAVNQQQDSFSQVAEIIAQISMTVADVGQSIQKVAHAAEQADEEARSGQVLVSETTKTIEGLAAEVERANQVIQRLDERSKAIGTVIDLIRNVAEQTNLLALNAAIEAARAGEQGRGFAVVADEVRSLASRTQSATQEIQQTIELVQRETTEAAQVMEQGRKTADHSVQQVVSAGKFLEAITRDVSTIKRMLADISDSTLAQTAMAEEVGTTLESIKVLSHRTADHANKTSSASHELAHLSQQLERQVAQFQV